MFPVSVHFWRSTQLLVFLIHGVCILGSTAEMARIIYPPMAQTIIVTKGQSLFLECVASGMPPPRITWAKDGSDVIDQNKTRFLLSNLLIEATNEEDSGTYTCTASNGIGDGGSAFIFYNVQVFGKLCQILIALKFSDLFDPSIQVNVA